MKGKSAMNEYDTEIAECSEAIRLNPDNAEAYRSRGDAYYEEDDYASAIEDYSKAIELDPNNVYAYHRRNVSTILRHIGLKN
jgi:serine/threonine-protein kinase